MSTEAAIDTDVIPDADTPPNEDFGGALDRWEEANKAAQPTEPSKPVAKAADETTKTGIPDELMSDGKKAPEVDPDETLLTDKPTGPIKHDHFERLQAKARRDIEAARKELDEYKVKVKEFEGRTGQPDEKTKAELESIRKEKAEFEAELERLAFERSPQFKKQFIARETATVERAKKAFTDAGGDVSLLPEIMAASGARRFQLLDDLDISQSAKHYLITTLSEHDAIQSEKTEALSQSRERLTAYEQEQQAEREAHQAKRTSDLSKLMDDVLTRTASEFAPLRKVEGNAAWNAEVDERMARVRRIAIGESNDKEILEVVARGVAAERIDQMFQTVRDENKKLREKIAGLEAASPSTANGHATTALNANETPEDRWERAQAAAMGNR